MAIAIEIGWQLCHEREIARDRYASALCTTYVEAILNRATIEQALHDLWSGASSYGEVGVEAALGLLQSEEAPNEVRIHLVDYVRVMRGRNNALAWLREIFQRERSIPSSDRMSLSEGISSGRPKIEELLVQLRIEFETHDIGVPVEVKREELGGYPSMVELFGEVPYCKRGTGE